MVVMAPKQSSLYIAHQGHEELRRIVVGHQINCLTVLPRQICRQQTSPREKPLLVVFHGIAYRVGTRCRLNGGCERRAGTVLNYSRAVNVIALCYDSGVTYSLPSQNGGWREVQK